MITQAASYFLDGCGRCPRFATKDCSARHWADGLALLRQLCLRAGLEETVRWGHPCYRHGGRNLALLGAFRTDFRITFPDASLLDDPNGLLEAAGPNSQAVTTIRFASLAALEQRQTAVSALLEQAVARAGQRPARTPKPMPELPGVLAQALAEDGELSAAFHLLTSGRQRSYVLALSSAKTEATQRDRLTRFRAAILSGKGANER